MFYVNSSSANTLDPKPSKATSEATTLVALLQKISPRFKKGSEVCLQSNCFTHKSLNFTLQPKLILHLSILKHSVKYWRAGLPPILLKMSSLCCHLILGLACTRFLVSSASYSLCHQCSCYIFISQQFCSRIWMLLLLIFYLLCLVVCFPYLLSIMVNF